jgi:hypothetical protein
MRTRRRLMTIAVLWIALAAVGCTDEVVVKTFPAACAGTKATLNIDQNGADGTLSPTLITNKGEALFKIGARNQSKRLFQSGHAPAPPARRDPNTIYTGDPVTISIKTVAGCPQVPKTLTVVLDTLLHKKHFLDGSSYNLSLDQFK